MWWWYTYDTEVSAWGPVRAERYVYVYTHLAQVGHTYVGCDAVGGVYASGHARGLAGPRCVHGRDVRVWTHGHYVELHTYNTRKGTARSCAEVTVTWYK